MSLELLVSMRSGYIAPFDTRLFYSSPFFRLKPVRSAPAIFRMVHLDWVGGTPQLQPCSNETFAKWFWSSISCSPPPAERTKTSLYERQYFERDFRDRFPPLSLSHTNVSHHEFDMDRYFPDSELLASSREC